VEGASQKAIAVTLGTLPLQRVELFVGCLKAGRDISLCSEASVRLVGFSRGVRHG
jgi:hypothetical protein